MSFSVEDEIRLSNLHALTEKSRRELLQKIEHTQKALRSYADLLTRLATLKPKDKIILAEYQARFSNLKDRKALNERLDQLSKYHANILDFEKKGTKEALDTPELNKPKKLFAPGYQKKESPTPFMKVSEKVNAFKAADNAAGNERLKDLLLVKDKLLRVHGSLEAALLSTIKTRGAEFTNFTLHHGVTYIEVVKLLLESGANPNFRDPEGNPLLVVAIYEEEEETVEALLKHRANPNQVLGDGNPILMYAIVSDVLPIVEKLLAAGANPQFLNNSGNTPMDEALVGFHSGAAKLLKKASKNYPSEKSLVQKMKVLRKAGGVLGINLKMPFYRADGSVFEVSSMGGYVHYSLPWLMHYLDQYCKKLRAEKKENLYRMFKKILSAYTLEARRVLLDPKVGFKEVMQAYEKGEPIFVSGGWEQHAVGAAFYKHKGGFINRGAEAMHPYYGTGVFEMPAKTVLNEELFKSFDSQEKNGPEVMKKISDLAGTNSIDPLETRHQKWGNCFFANTKPGVEVFLYWLSLEAGENEESAKAFALRSYKDFTEFMRNEMCRELVEVYRANPSDREFYEKIFEEVIRTHNGASVYGKLSRSRDKKIKAELTRAAMLIQAIADVDKRRAAEFLNRLSLVTSTLKNFAVAYYPPLSELIKELSETQKPLDEVTKFKPAILPKIAEPRKPHVFPPKPAHPKPVAAPTTRIGKLKQILERSKSAEPPPSTPPGKRKV